MRKELCISALDAAFELRKPEFGVIVHSDAGSQYTSEAYKLALGKQHAVQSMSDVGIIMMLYNKEYYWGQSQSDGN